ncbi:MAG: lysophospholipase L1-like esterase [Limisphaerales bacterium]|jgi:lysophospholipase L1-like esterase
MIPKMTLRRRIGFRAAAVLLPILGLTLLAEVVLKTWFPNDRADSAQVYRYDEVLGVCPKVNLRFSDSTDHYREMFSNAKGTMNLRESFADYEHLVFAIGDSYTQGTGVGFDTSYPFQLDLRLNLDTNGYRKHYGVVNLGLAAYGTRQAVLTAKRFAGDMGDPDYLLYLAAPNDVADDRLFSSGYRHRHRVEGNPNHLIPASWVHWISKTELGFRLKRVIFTLRIQSAKAPTGNDQTPELASPSWAELQSEHLSELKRLAGELDAMLIVGFAATGSDYDSLRRWALEENVRFADWLPRVESVLAENPELPIRNTHSGGHFRPWVYRQMAEAFARSIESLGLEP